MEKIVEFEKYCKYCKYWEKKESDDPCYDCLATPSQTDSRKPYKWEEGIVKFDSVLNNEIIKRKILN